MLRRYVNEIEFPSITPVKFNLRGVIRNKKMHLNRKLDTKALTMWLLPLFPVIQITGNSEPIIPTF